MESHVVLDPCKIKTGLATMLSQMKQCKQGNISSLVTFLGHLAEETLHDNGLGAKLGCFTRK